MIKDLIKLANHLDKLGLTMEANSVDYLIKSAQATGRVSALKHLLQDTLREHGYKVGKPEDPENIDDSGSPRYINVPLDVTSNSWGNTDQAWFAFANNVLRIPAIATDWQTVAPTIGQGYKGTLAGMMNLLEDFAGGGRARVGADMGHQGTEELAEQTDALQRGIEDKVPILMAPDAAQRGFEFEERRDDLEREAYRANPPAQPKPDVPASGQVARPEQTGETTWEYAGWTQVRNPNGTIKHYIDDGGRTLHSPMANTRISGYSLNDAPWVQQ